MWWPERGSGVGWGHAGRGQVLEKYPAVIGMVSGGV